MVRSHCWLKWEYRFVCIADDLHTLGTIECEQPRTDLYTFNGRIHLSAQMLQRDSNVISSSTPTLLQRITPLPTAVVPLMTDNLLLRGSRIKNTEWAIGCAVYTGKYYVEEDGGGGGGGCHSDAPRPFRLDAQAPTRSCRSTAA